MTPAEGGTILSMSGQALLFLSTVLVGGLIGVFFDVFRILRRTFPIFANSVIVQIEDIFFWAAVTGMTFYFMLNQSYGEIRVFSVIGAGIGIALYFATISRVVMKVFVSLIEYMKKVVTVAFRIILFPLKTVYKWLYAPIKWSGGKVRSVLRKIKRYGKIRLRKYSRNWFILRKKV